jgi:hypothetical protein
MEAAVERERPNTNPDAGVADDKIAEARERIGRVQKDSGLTDKAKGNGDDDIEVSSVSGGDAKK